ncbi:MAG TPA: CoA transferase [Advenella sp.]|nr:CoA transferase [Advenella sp.]
MSDRQSAAAGMEPLLNNQPNNLPDNHTPSGPLKGIRIADLTSVVMGPFATQLLADLGADVIKIESPTGDTTRNMGHRQHQGMGANFLQLNRNKRSIVLDLKTDDGRQACLDIAATADVFLYNVRPQAMARLGLSYETVRAVNPQIVYAGTYGFGNAGPYAGKPAYDDLIQGMTGIAALYQQHTGQPPRYVPLTMADKIIGMQVAIACLAGVLESRSSGQGQSIEIPMFEGMAQFVLGDHFGGATFVPPKGDMGYTRLLTESRKPYMTLDGYICTVIHTDKHWQNFLGLLNRQDLLQADSPFATIASRGVHVNQVYGFIEDTLRTRSSAHWLDALGQADIPVAPLYAIDELLDDPHLKAVQQIVELDHPTEGRVQTVAPLGTYSRTQPSIYRHAPNLGEHTDEILQETARAISSRRDSRQ